MSVTVTKKSDTGSAALKGVERNIKSRRNIVEVAGAVKGVIVARTLRGQSARGPVFPPYTENYRKWKVKTGRPGIPNLSLSGAMLGDIQFEIESPTRANLHFISALSRAKAHRHHTGKYYFFDILPSEATNIEAALLRELNRQGKAKWKKKGR